MKRFMSLGMAILFVLSALLGSAPVAHAAAPGAPAFAAALPSPERRAAQHLEDLRQSEMAPNWGRAVLGGRRNLFRPDLRSAAYAEFPVIVDGRAAGFIILSLGEHDFPIAHWNDQGATPTAFLRSQAKKLERSIARYYKLDTLTYAAEDANGDLIALYPPNTPLPTKVSGQNPDTVGKPVRLTHETWSPTSGDEQGKPQHRQSQSGPAPDGKIQLGGWENWKEFKGGFGQAYQTMLLSLAREAKHDWDIDKAAAEQGEGLVVGRGCQPVAALSDVAEIALRGDGSVNVQAGIRQRDGLPPVIDLCVISVPEREGARFDLLISYKNRKSELLPYAVLSESFDDNAPQAGAAVETQQGGLDAPQGAWGPWTYYWAGNSGHQRYYSQIAAGTFNNTTGCYSGCGATAWAMLFGWADNQAALGNAYWAPRWGLYRTNGGYGADAVAPASMTTGIRNISMEIRNRIGTFCAFGSGATPPWDMDGAAGYLSGRTGTRLRTHYNVLGIHEGRLREYARDSIRDRNTPAIIGTGWLTHYPLAWGYAWRSRTVNVLWWTETEYSRWFYVNQGWGGSGDGWVSAGTWFAGEILP